jgi:hypothetical protein
VKFPTGVVVLGVFLAGCGGGGSGAPKPIQGPAKEAADVVQRLETAIAKHDFSAICDDLFAATTQKQAGGANCPSVLAAREGGVRHPRMRIQSIVIQGAEAEVHVRTTAVGQAATTDVLRLVREGGKFRVASLGR